ncbi:hypothetical protein WJX74_009137 [Apatococcus lobatus]|uniref:Uncharacterized protein n=1 Tax=Apatococcus lobatus TaxID=904363 RepID=A0AAW1SAZ8_9CHLO
MIGLRGLAKICHHQQAEAVQTQQPAIIGWDRARDLPDSILACQVQTVQCNSARTRVHLLDRSIRLMMADRMLEDAALELPSPEEDQIRQLKEELARKEMCGPDQTRASHVSARGRGSARGRAPSKPIRQSERLAAARARKHQAQQQQPAVPDDSPDQTGHARASSVSALTDCCDMLDLLNL